MTMLFQPYFFLNMSFIKYIDVDISIIISSIVKNFSTQKLTKKKNQTNYLI